MVQACHLQDFKAAQGAPMTQVEKDPQASIHKALEVLGDLTSSAPAGDVL